MNSYILAFQQGCKTFGNSPGWTKKIGSVSTGRTAIVCSCSSQRGSGGIRHAYSQQSWLTSLGQNFATIAGRHRYQLLHSCSIADLGRITKCLEGKVNQQGPGQTPVDICSVHEDSRPSENCCTKDLFPFEGESSEDKSLETLMKGDRGDKKNDSFSVERQDTLEGRFYHITGSDGSEFSLPSVTTVLDNTMSPRSYFSLRNWRKNMIKEHGEVGFKRLKAERIRDGTRFHKV